MSKKIFITGASGFAGKYLVKELLASPDIEIFGTYHSQSGSESLASISPKINLVQLDLMDNLAVGKALKDINPDQIYHLAALSSAKQSFEEPQRVITNNIVSELNLLESIKNMNLKTRTMIISSAEVYGIIDHKDIPVDEETPLRPANPYAVSKITQDFLGLQYNISYGLDIVRIRPFNHIGPGQTDRFSTAEFAKKIAEIEIGKREPILTVGNLEAKRDFTDVKDMIKAYVLLMEKGKSGDVYNIGSGKSYKMSDVLNMLLSFSKSKIKVETDPKLFRASDNPELVCDNTKIFKLTGWQPKIPLEKSLREILDYWRKTV